MSVRARAAAAGASPAGAGAGGVTGAAGAPGLLLGRLTVLPTLLVMAWLLVGLPLLLLGVFSPVLMLVVSVPLAVVLVVAGLRWLPGRWESPFPVRTPAQARTPWWAVLGVIAVAVAFGADQLIYHSQQIIIMRDPASYIQFANWISQHGSLPMPADRAAFGGNHPGMYFYSFAYYHLQGRGDAAVHGGTADAPGGRLLDRRGRRGGALGPVLGAFGVLTFGGLAARLAGPRWAPLAALILALSLPEQFTSRSTYSEPVVQILFLGGLCLVIDSLGADDGMARRSPRRSAAWPWA